MDYTPEIKRCKRMNGSVNNSRTASDFPQSLPRKTDRNYLTRVLQLVSTHEQTTLDLKSPEGAKWTVGDLNDTIYKGNNRKLNGWGKFYLPYEVTMQVVGVVDGTLCPSDQLVLMTCEDGKIYAYDGEELHEVAPSLQELCEEGMEYPANKSYYRGEAFKDMTEEDWEEVRNGPVGKRLDEAHYKLVTDDTRFLENLKSISQYTSVC